MARPYGLLEETIEKSDLQDQLKGWLLHDLSRHTWGTVRVPVFDEFDSPISEGCVTCGTQSCRTRTEIASRMGVDYWPDSSGYDPRKKATT